MFDRHDSGIGLWPGESIEEVEAGQSADLSYRLTCLALADGWVEADRDLLPDTLEDIPVGPFLAAVVSSVDRSRLNGHDAVRLMQTEARLASCHEAQKLASMAEVACSPAGHADSAVERSFDEIEYVAVEIAAALTLTRRAAESQLNQAVSLTGRLARVWDSFSQGLIDLAKARVFDQQLGHLPEATVDTILDRTLDAAPGLTTGQLRARISREVMEADPDGAASGFHEGLRDRKLTFYPNPDFTASLGLRSVDPSDLAAVLANIDRIARLLKVEGEGRAPSTRSGPTSPSTCSRDTVSAVSRPTLVVGSTSTSTWLPWSDHPTSPVNSPDTARCSPKSPARRLCDRSTGNGPTRSPTTGR